MTYEQVEHELSIILLKFYEDLEKIAYLNHEIVAADVIDFSSKKNAKILARAEGIISSFIDAYLTATISFEDIVLKKYRSPSLTQRRVCDEALKKLGKNFERLLKIIRAKAQVAIEEIEENNLTFEQMDVLQLIEKITFKEILDSWLSGDYLFQRK